jgi:hypothetical protein
VGWPDVGVPAFGESLVEQLRSDPKRLATGYEESSPVMTEVGRDHGLLLHAAAKTEHGLLVVNLWPSKDGSEAAASDRRRNGVIERHGLTPDRFRREHYRDVSYVLFE